MSVHFVSLGPGSVESVTLGAVKVINEADIIYCFGSNGRSRAREIIALVDKELLRKVVCIDAPMSKDRTYIYKVYDNLAETIRYDVGCGRSVAVATEGDSGVYATTHYVMDRLVDAGVECCQMPGVPSFIAAGALAGLHLVEQRQRLVVVPGRVTADEIEQIVDDGCTLVVMKLSMACDAVNNVLSHRKDVTFHYFENIGTPEQKYEILSEPRESFPYFSLMIIKVTKY